jgi:hydrogenase maturation protein HypF
VSIGSGEPDDLPVILATGGDIKTTFALTGRHGRAHLSSHLGDMADPRTQDCFAAAVDHLGFLTGSAPTVLAHDLHPQYATTRWAQRRGDRLLAVQHHHAHVVSLLAEHRRLGEPIIAVTYDGTGFGTDGTIWGGELLAVRDPARFTRVGHLAPFALPGGEGAVRQPARIALDLLDRAGIEASDDLPPVAASAQPACTSSPSNCGAAWDACPPQAWGGSSMRCPAFSGCAGRSATKVRPRSSWSTGPVPGVPGGPSTSR